MSALFQRAEATSSVGLACILLLALCSGTNAQSPMRLTDREPSPVLRADFTPGALQSGTAMQAAYLDSEHHVQASHGYRAKCTCGYCVTVGEGRWHWLRDEEEEKRRAVRIYNTQCVRCHGVQGKGVWDIPDVPNFTNRRWQLSRSDADIVRLTLGGRGACMPAFKGTITTDEAWAIARYIRVLGQSPPERATDADASATKEAAERQSRPSSDYGNSDDTATPEPIQAGAPTFLRSR